MVANKHDDLVIKIATIKPGERGVATNKKVTWEKLKDLLSDPIKDKKYTLPQYLDLHIDKQNVIKDVGSFVGGHFRDGRRKNRNLIQRSFISLDIDSATPEQIEQLKGGSSEVCRYEFFASTTRKHQSKKPRWRVVFPLTRPLDPEEYTPISRILASTVFDDLDESMDAIDDVSYRPAQIMYWPSVCKLAKFETIHNEGRLINPDKYLDKVDFDWTDWSQLPFSKKRKKQRMGGNVDAEDPRTKKGIIGAFCRVYDIESAIETFIPDIYAPGDQDSGDIRYSYLLGSSSNGIVIYDDNLFMYSHHGTDPLAETNTNAFDMVRVHKFGDLDLNEPEDTKPFSLPSYKAMVKFLKSDSAVMAEYEEAGDDYGSNNRVPITFKDLGESKTDRKKSKSKTRANDNDPEDDRDENGDLATIDDLPNLALLNNSAIPAPAFPREVLGEYWSDKIAEWSDGTGSPYDYGAMGLITVASTLIGNARWAMVDNQWKEPPVVWTALVGPPSANKSPAMNPFKPIFRRLMNDWMPENMKNLAEYEKAKYAAESKYSQWKKETAETIAAGSNEIDDIPADAFAPALPLERRITLDDATIEALVEAASRNPRGLLMMKDELNSLFANMGRYTNGGNDRPIYIQGFGGRDYQIDRKSNKGTIVVERFFLSVLGNIQPEILGQLLSSQQDGFQARFFFVWPDQTGSDRTLDEFDFSEDTDAYRALKKLTKLEMITDYTGKDIPVDLRMTKKAKRVFLEWYNPQRQADGKMGNALGTAYGKSYGMVVRMALILEHLWWSGEYGIKDPPDCISAKAVKTAINFMEDYIKPMMRRAYRHMEKSEDEIYARQVVDWMFATNPKVFNTQDIYKDKENSTFKRKMPPIVAGVEFLVEENWIIPVEAASTGKAGRPAKWYKPHPMVKTIAKQMQKEKDKRAKFIKAQ